jgi:twinkle protein
MSETDYISHALKRCRQFARRMGVHVWMVAHPAKLRKDNDGTYPVPTLYDISGSAHWRNKADNGLCLWRDFGNHMAPVEVHVQKIRFKQIGSIGMAQLRYRKVTGRYLDAAAG